MKKVITILILMNTINIVYAQNLQKKLTEKRIQTTKKNWLIEINTGSYAIGNTSFVYFKNDNNEYWSLGIEGGYFVLDDLAAKLGIGYSEGNFTSFTKSNGTSVFRYKIGVKYYFDSKYPIVVDYTGATSFTEDTSLNYIGIQSGYAFFIGKQISIEPTLRYNFALDSNQDGAFQGLIGFALFL